MPLFTWTEDLSVGIAEFDAHHRRLVELINELHEAGSGGLPRVNLGSVLLSLSHYIIYHFLAEEEVMHRWQYPETESHRREHMLLTEKTLGFVAAFHRGDENITKDLLVFLVSWLQNHIRTVDKKYQAFLTAKGVH